MEGGRGRAPKTNGSTKPSAVDGKMVGVTPTEVSVQWAPFRHNEVQLKLPHRRAVVLDLQKDVGLLCLSWEVITFRWGRLSSKVPRTVHRMHLVRKHGPAGTWGPEMPSSYR